MADHDHDPQGGPPPPPPPPPPPGAQAQGGAVAGQAASPELARAVAALVDADTERRQALVRLGELVERTAARMDEVAGASAALRSLGPDLEAALVEAGRRLGEHNARLDSVQAEVAGLGPLLNELVDRRPDWAAVLEPLDARLSVQADARAADRELLEHVAAQVGGLREVAEAGAGPDALAEAVRAELAPLVDAVRALGSGPAGTAPDAATVGGGDPAVAEAQAELARLAEATERLAHRLTDGLGSVRDAAMAPAADLQAMIGARAEHTDERLAALADQVATLIAAVEDVAARGSDVDPRAPDPQADADALAGTIAATVADAATAAVTDALAAQPPPPAPPAPAAPPVDVDALVWAVRTAVLDTLDQHRPAAPVDPPTLDLPPMEQRLDTAFADIERSVGARTEAAMAGLLRLLDDRFDALRTEVARNAGSTGGGFEAGAVLGASQAAWNRLEDRLDGEFDDLGRQLHALGVLVERALDQAGQRQPLVSGDGIRKAAASVRDTVVSASRTRRDRRGGPRGLGPGD